MEVWEWSAPRERGSTPVADAEQARFCVCPARAGIDRPPTRRMRCCGSLPRASGDRPQRLGLRMAGSRSAPRERGSTLGWEIQRLRGEVCPARAGIDPGRWWSSRWIRSLPRASGDRPQRPHRVCVGSQSAPRERGSTSSFLALLSGQEVCPARAGIDPPLCRRARWSRGLPRASGDRPADAFLRDELARSAPRERGSTHRAGRGRDRVPVCPARAGIDPMHSPESRARASLPRASGDRPIEQDADVIVFLSAPRERGSTLGLGVRRQLMGVCPARAGIDPRSATPSRPSRCLPRASGDRPWKKVGSVMLRGSAPRERGSTICEESRVQRVRVCPARAGIDL